MSFPAVLIALLIDEFVCVHIIFERIMFRYKRLGNDFAAGDKLNRLFVIFVFIH